MPVGPDLQRTLERVADLYSNSLREHGATAEGVLWRNAETHGLRFEQLVQVIEDNRRPFTVADLGCGYGALFEYMKTLGMNLKAYTGVDLSDEALRIAQERIHDPRARFLKGDSIPEEVDYAFASGIFNVRFETEHDEWNHFMRETIIAMAAKARIGIAFNALSTYVEWQGPKLHYADPLAYFDFCERNISSRVSLFHDYPLWEWTLCIKKEG